VIIHSNDTDLSSLRHLGLSIEDWKLDLASEDVAPGKTVYVIVRTLGFYRYPGTHLYDTGYLGNGGLHLQQYQQAERFGGPADRTEWL
jgi:hypothetical protein